jgi:hypothetical protein
MVVQACSTFFLSHGTSREKVLAKHHFVENMPNLEGAKFEIEKLKRVEYEYGRRVDCIELAHDTVFKLFCSCTLAMIIT